MDRRPTSGGSRVTPTIGHAPGLHASKPRGKPKAPTLSTLPLPPGLPPGTPSPAPVFVGHYWFAGKPGPQNDRTAVLDYGACLNGPLVAYRWDGEATLDPERFVAA